MTTVAGRQQAAAADHTVAAAASQRIACEPLRDQGVTTESSINACA